MNKIVKKIMPKSAIGRLYVGTFAVLTAVSLTIGVTTTVVGAAINSRA